MRITTLTLWLLTCSLATTDLLLAQQQGDLYCAVTYKGQNRNRTVAGAVNVECGDGEIHSTPFGNWGVVSFYGGKSDTDQFRGWKWLDGPSTKKQWNSCTTDLAQYHPPNCAYYNDKGCTTQRSNDVVTHGTVTYRSKNQCPQYLDPDNPKPPGCANQASATVTKNNMSLYELDGWRLGRPGPNDDDFVENLYFPSTTVTFTNCNYDGCSEKTSAWKQMTGSSSSSADVRAEIRMRAKAQVVGYCDTGNSDWNWD
ncbi:MAG: hypothetical protein F4X19_04700 [Acidobacteria bacterium]|nr:hypothetical protein [Acidobacteriota bacterium]